MNTHARGHRDATELSRQRERVSSHWGPRTGMKQLLKRKMETQSGGRRQTQEHLQAHVAPVSGDATEYVYNSDGVLAFPPRLS
jgi:hypothetical protein